MASTSFSFDGYYPMPSQPIAMPQKSSDYLAAFDTVDYRISGSPPEAPDSGTTSGITSYDPTPMDTSLVQQAQA